jgi:hypothetical protein
MEGHQGFNPEGYRFFLLATIPNPNLSNETGLLQVNLAWCTTGEDTPNSCNDGLDAIKLFERFPPSIIRKQGWWPRSISNLLEWRVALEYVDAGFEFIRKFQVEGELHSKPKPVSGMYKLAELIEDLWRSKRFTPNHESVVLDSTQPDIRALILHYCDRVEGGEQMLQNFVFYSLLALEEFEKKFKVPANTRSRLIQESQIDPKQ